MVLKSINYWSFPGGLDGTLDPFEAIRLAKQTGFDAIELCVGDVGSAFPVDASMEFCDELKAAAAAAGLSVPSVASGLYWSRALGDDDADSRKHALEDLKSMLQIASRLGAKTLLTIPGAVDVFFLPERPVMRYDRVRYRAIEGLREALPVAEKCQVRMGIENVWSKFLLSPTEMEAFLAELNSPWVGAYLDVANILPYGYPEQWIRILGKKIVGIHFKDFRKSVGTLDGFVDLLEGDVNWPEVMAAIEETGYDGPVVGEMIPGYRFHPMVRIKNTSNAMDAILGRS